MTLVEQYVPGTVRSASGGDTRLLRAAHGEATWYAESAVRAREAWLELERRTGTHLWEPVGLAWFAHRPDGFEAASRDSLETLGVEHRWLAPEEARPFYPSLGVGDLHGVLFEPQAGVIHARTATRLLAEDAVAAGVELVTRRSAPGEEAAADAVVWASGAWLAKHFPEHVGLTVSRRDPAPYPRRRS